MQLRSDSMSSEDVSALARELAKVGERNTILWQEHKENSNEKWAELRDSLKSINNRLDSRSCVANMIRIEALEKKVESANTKLDYVYKFTISASAVLSCALIYLKLFN